MSMYASVYLCVCLHMPESEYVDFAAWLLNYVHHRRRQCPAELLYNSPLFRLFLCQQLHTSSLNILHLFILAARLHIPLGLHIMEIRAHFHEISCVGWLIENHFPLSTK